jgi:hypothetical protein
MRTDDENDVSTVTIGTDNVAPVPVPAPALTRRTVKSLTAKLVCFSTVVKCRLHLHIIDFTEEEYVATFYQQDEYDRMVVELIHHHHQKQLLQVVKRQQRHKQDAKKRSSDTNGSA